MATTETHAPNLPADKNQQPQPARGSRGNARHNGRWSGYRHLLWARMLEMEREPEVVFWVFIFPLLLAAGLGIAFRNNPADITSVVVVEGAGAQKTLAMLQNSDKSSPGHSPARSNIRATVLDRDAALKAFHLGKFDLAIESNPDGSYTFYYDPARPESVLSRAEIDARLQSAAGRKDALITSAQSSSAPGSRYIDFLIPGLLGMNLMNSGMWGVGFALVEMRQRKLLKRFVATPMRRSDFLLALASSRLVLMVIEVGLLLGFGVLVFHMPVQEIDHLGHPARIARSRSLRRRRPPNRLPGAEDRNRFRPHQPGHDADVDLLRRLLLLPKISRDHLPLHQGPPANRSQRRAQSHDLRRRPASFPIGAPACARSLGRSVVHPGSALVPLDVEELSAISY